MPRPRPFPTLKESQVRRLAAPAAFAAGATLWQDGAVGRGTLALHEPLIMAQVQGGAQNELTVIVRHQAGDEFDAQCDCGTGGLCAHAVALLLAWVNESYTFERVDAAPAARAQAASLQYQWRHYLQAASLAQLRAITRRHGISHAGADRASLLARVAEHLAQPETGRQAVATLSEAQKRVFQMLYILSDGQPDTTVADLQEALGWLEISPVEEALRELRERGLVVTLPSHWFRSDPYTIAPGAGPLVPPMTGQWPAADGFDQPRLGVVHPFSGDLSRLRIVSGGVSVPEIMLLAPHLTLKVRRQPPDLAQAHAIKALRDWPYELDEMVRLQVKPGWLHQPDSVLSVPPPAPRLDDESLAALRPLTGADDLSDFISYLLPDPPRAEAHDTRVIFAAWQRTTAWTELWPVMSEHGLKGRRSVLAAHMTYAHWLEQLARARRFITRLLSLLPGGIWHDFASLLETTHAINADFLRERQPFPLQPAWWLETNGSRIDPRTLDAWRGAYGAFIERIVSGPLRWLGAVELAVQDAHPADETADPISVRAVRLTPLGEALLRGGELPTPNAPERALRLSDDLGAQLPLARNDFSAFLALERLARFEQVSDGHAAYRFDEEHAHAAFEYGLTLDDVLAQLARLADGPLPARVLTQWQDWWARYGRVRWYDDLTVFELADDYILQELLTQTDLKEHVLFTFSPRLIVVRPESADALTRQLVKKGYTPRVE
ncbi:MAG: helicase-associated domain-containing protein [Chloroflexi bacterium]|nr:helicase-associated domain-containing protein [Chloroflexota bacterium]